MRADKQRSVLDGGLRVFARDGFSRATIQSLAAEANVSTRTIYNQYGNKDALFRAVILDSASHVAERQIALVEGTLDGPGSLRDRLISFGRAWSRHDPNTAEHFAMIRQVHADADHIDPEVLREWRRIGPARVRGEIADRLADLAQAGSLSIPDATIAALHLIQLTAGTVRDYPDRPDPDTVVTAGVDAFLTAYRPSGRA